MLLLLPLLLLLVLVFLLLLMVFVLFLLLSQFWALTNVSGVIDTVDVVGACVAVAEWTI